jgi:hypothetical protein
MPHDLEVGEISGETMWSATAGVTTVVRKLKGCSSENLVGRLRSTLQYFAVNNLILEMK